jgi:hypothetical protein
MLEPNNVSDDAKAEIIKDLLKELPTDTAVEVLLPSECKVYDLIDPGVPVSIRPMTFEDEKNIVGAKKGEDPINLVLNRCVSNVKVLDLLPMDKFFLIMKLREISYGDDYHTLLICPECRAENPTTVRLSQLNVNPVPDEFTDPISITLPQLKKEIKVKLPRVRDEAIFNNPEDFLDQLWRFVLEIDGHTDKSIIAAVVNKLPLKDSKTILNALKSDYGVDTKIKFQCKDCEGISVKDLPLDASFFDVS